MKKKTKKARCKYVLAILNNEIKRYELLREETFPPTGDFADYPTSYAIVNEIVKGFTVEVMIPLNTVVFLK